MWKKIRESVLFLLLGLIVFVYGAWHIVTLVIMPHLNRLLKKS